MSEYADDVDVAFAGRQVGSFFDEDNRYIRILIFEVDRVYKGHVGPVIEVHTYSGGNAFCGVDFGGWGSVGIAGRRSEDSEVLVSICRGHVTVGELEDVFGAGYPPDHTPGLDALGREFPGVFDGTGCGQRLCPQEPLRRWEMAVWLVRVLDRTNPTGQVTPRFDDVGIDVWWAPHPHRLAELEVTKGCDTATFCPHKEVTRAQMATFLVRALDLETGPAAGFADTEGSTHEANIDALFAAGITHGCQTAPLRYCPHKAVTRAQMATFLARVLGLI